MPDTFKLLTNKINPNVRKIVESIYAMARRYPATAGQWCGRGWDTKASSAEHNTGLAVDWIISAAVGVRPTAIQRTGALALCNWAIANARQLDLQWILFSYDGVGTWSWSTARGTWKYLGNRGNISANHIDHIHFKFLPGVDARGVNWSIPGLDGGSVSPGGKAISLSTLILQAGMSPRTKSNEVVKYQAALNAAGFDAGAEDGYYGTNVRSATARLQASMGFKGRDADGVVGRKSLEHLSDLLVGRNPGFTAVS